MTIENSGRMIAFVCMQFFSLSPNFPIELSILR
jgi:hypothetical protein